MSEIDSLIVQAEEDVESAKKRLAMLKTLKSSMKVSASVSVGVEEAAQMLGISEIFCNIEDSKADDIKSILIFLSKKFTVCEFLKI